MIARPLLLALLAVPSTAGAAATDPHAAMYRGVWTTLARQGEDPALARGRQAVIARLMQITRSQGWDPPPDFEAMIAGMQAANGTADPGRLFAGSPPPSPSPEQQAAMMQARQLALLLAAFGRGDSAPEGLPGFIEGRGEETLRARLLAEYEAYRRGPPPRAGAEASLEAFLTSLGRMGPATDPPGHASHARAFNEWVQRLYRPGSTGETTAVGGSGGPGRIPAGPPRLDRFDYSAVAANRGAAAAGRLYWSSGPQGLRLLRRGTGDSATDTHEGTVWRNPGTNELYLNVHGNNIDPATGVEVWGSVFAYNPTRVRRGRSVVSRPPAGVVAAHYHGGRGAHVATAENPPSAPSGPTRGVPGVPALRLGEHEDRTYLYRHNSDGTYLLSPYPIQTAEGAATPFRTVSLNGASVQAAPLDANGPHAGYYITMNGEILETAWRYDGNTLVSFIRPMGRSGTSPPPSPVSPTPPVPPTPITPTTPAPPTPVPMVNNGAFPETVAPALERRRGPRVFSYTTADSRRQYQASIGDAAYILPNGGLLMRQPWQGSTSVVMRPPGGAWRTLTEEEAGSYDVVEGLREIDAARAAWEWVPLADNAAFSAETLVPAPHLRVDARIFSYTTTSTRHNFQASIGDAAYILPNGSLLMRQPYAGSTGVVIRPPGEGWRFATAEELRSADVTAGLGKIDEARGAWNWVPLVDNSAFSSEAAAPLPDRRRGPRIFTYTTTNTRPNFQASIGDAAYILPNGNLLMRQPYAGSTGVVIRQPGEGNSWRHATEEELRSAEVVAGLREIDQARAAWRWVSPARPPSTPIPTPPIIPPDLPGPRRVPGP